MKKIICKLLIVILSLLSPVLLYFGGWMAGHVANWLIGNLLVKGANYMFGTNFTTDMIPMIFGILNVIGGFFCRNRTNIDFEEDI